MYQLISVLLFVFLPQMAIAAEYPNMVGTWRANLRTISSGPSVDSQVASGGIVISEVDAVVTIDHQEGEAFLGKVRLSSMSNQDPSIPMWGAIRSDKDEAMFVGGDGSRGPMWFIDDTSYEFCVTNLTDEGVMMAYCGIFRKDLPQDN